jgi:Flp pilus assembly protein CpaB
LDEIADSSNQSVRAPEEETATAAHIPRGYRAVSVVVPTFGVAEIAAPGDRVDVVVYLPPESDGPGSEPSAHTLFQDVKVLGIAQSFRRPLPGDGAGPGTATFLLLVTPEQGRRLLLAAELGKIGLMLRNPEDDAQLDTEAAERIGDDRSDEFWWARDDDNDEETEAGNKLSFKDYVDLLPTVEAADDPSERESVEVDLGKFVITATDPISSTTLRIDFHLCATVDADRESEFTALLEKKRHRFRDLVSSIIRGAEHQDLVDPSLGLIKRKIMDETNRTLGEPLVDAIFFSDFSVAEQ